MIWHILKPISRVFYNIKPKSKLEFLESTERANEFEKLSQFMKLMLSVATQFFPSYFSYDK